jgi:NTP pyrophosphatase (non-canonical NTP hydrolase)
MTTITDKWDILYSEIEGADDKYGPFTSTHEGLGVLAEEYAELIEAIRRNDVDSIVHEALQVAAVAIRLACCLDYAIVRERSNCSAPAKAEGEKRLDKREQGA